MNSYGIKIRHIMPTFFYVSLGTLLGVSLTRYFFAIEFQLLDFKIEMWELWIPLGLPWIPITIWLRPKLRILSFDEYDDKRRFLFQVLTWGTMVSSLMVSQKYLTTATGTIQDTADILELDKTKETRYYRIKSFEVLPTFGVSYADVSTSGNYNQHLDIHMYFACPIIKDKISARTNKLKYWYGVSFKKTISNRLEVDEKEKRYNEFYRECVGNMQRYPFNQLAYFERLPNSKGRDGYLNAVKNSTKEDVGDIVILESRQEPFEKRNGNMFLWIFGSYGIGLAVILLALTWPGYSTLELERQLAGKKPESDDVIDMMKFLIPRKPHLVTSIVLDLNILVFVAMLFAGINIISPNGLQLLDWGANRRAETLSGDWWRLLTSMFLHGGVMHLFLNIYGLVLASMFVEPMLGARRYALIYFVSGITGSIASISWYENIISVGASGAIFGLCGAVLAVVFTGFVGKEDKRLALILFGPYVVINLLIGLAAGGIDNAAHIGGLISGAVVALIIYTAWKPELSRDTSS
jgi:rhomboid protease GluP